MAHWQHIGKLKSTTIAKGPALKTSYQQHTLHFELYQFYLSCIVTLLYISQKPCFIKQYLLDTSLCLLLEHELLERSKHYTVTRGPGPEKSTNKDNPIRNRDPIQVLVQYNTLSK